MVRKTALVTAMLGAFASHAYALGLGEITLNSALHQPLDAEVAVLSASPEEVDELNVSLAPPAAYERAGVERIYLHTKLRFSVERKPDGSAVVRVTSQDPIREPYLDFLLEASWGSGQVVREYTMLIDPPVLMPSEPAPAPSAPAVSQAAPRQTAPMRDRRMATFTGSEYGPVQRNDTLWTIAEQVRPDTGVSMQQTMLGLVRANPEAFQHGNVNNLKAGYVLRVPPRQEFTSISQAEAQREVNRQHRLWREGRSEETQPSASGEVQRSAEPATEAESSASATSATREQSSDAQLKLVTPEEAASTTAAAAGEGGEAEVEQVRKDLALAVEELEAQRQQNQDLNDRLADLEQQIAQLHRLVELSDSDLARLQQGAAAEPGQETAAAVPATGTDEMVAEAPDSADAVEAQGEDAMPSGAAESAESGMEPMPQAQEMPAPEAETPPALQEEVIQDEVIQEPPAEKGIVERFLTNPLMQIGAGAVALLLLVLAWLSARKRRMGSTAFKESILAEPRNPASAPSNAAGSTTVEAAAAATAAAAAAEEEDKPDGQESASGQSAGGPQSDSSLFTDFSVSDMGAIQNEAEADPIAEADVYLAYGRYQQAEELVKAAVDKEPERNDLRMKLLEIYFAAKNQSAFDSEAEALLAQLESQDDSMWQRVVEMGRELNPQSRLYRGEGAAESSAEVAEAPAAEPEPAVAEPATDESAEADTLESLDFDLDRDAEAGSEPETASEPAGELAEGEEDNTLDFNLDDLDSLSESSSVSEAEETAETPMVEEDDNLLEFDLAEAEAKAQDAEAEEVGIDDGELQAGDEVSTKLDLARAYIEMGDPEGAKSILEEVLDEGNDAQKSEAETLLKDVG